MQSLKARIKAIREKQVFRRMIKVKATANYGFAGTDMQFEEEFDDDVTDEEIEGTMRDIVMEQVDWSWERSNYE